VAKQACAPSLNLLIFFYCINFGFYFVGHALQIPSILHLSNVNFATEATRYGTMANNTGTSVSFLSPFSVFGDFISGLNILWQLVSGGMIVNTVQNLVGMPSEMVLFVQVIVSLSQILAVLYMITGRGSEIST
jgi:hypothetical protein